MLESEIVWFIVRRAENEKNNCATWYDIKFELWNDVRVEYVKNIVKIENVCIKWMDKFEC